MAAVQSAPLFALPPAPPALHAPFPHPQPPPAAAVAAPAPHDHSDGEEDDDGDDGQLHWWLQGHGPAAPAAAQQQQHQQRRRAHHHHNGPRGPAAAATGRVGREDGVEEGDEEPGAHDGPLAFLFRQLVVHPVRALARGLSGSKKKGHHHHHGGLDHPHPHHHAHHPETPEAAAAEPEEEEVVEEEEEEEEPAPVLLVGVPRVYSCGECRTHLASDMDVISRAFQGRGGRAFLLDRVVNAVAGPPEDRLLMTGVHTVADLCCAGCKALLGWKYEKAHEPSQRYKEGKFILERVRLYHEAEDGEGGAHNEGWLAL